DFRQLPLKDGQGLDNTKSVKEVTPQNALETLVRHFTDSIERKRAARELTDAASHQVKRAEELSITARDYSAVVDRILEDYCRVAGVSSKEVAPTMSAEEIAEVRDFSEKLSAFSGVRKEFTDAARLAEQRLQEKETADTMRTTQDSRAETERTWSQSHSPSQSTTESHRTDRTDYSRGR